MYTNLWQQFLSWTKLKFKLDTQKKIGFYFSEREIWWASLGKNIGYEQDGKNEKFERPILVLKKFSKDSLLAIPMTSKVKSGKYYLALDYKNKKYSLLISQIRFISSKRLSRKIRMLNKREFIEARNLVRNII